MRYVVVIAAFWVFAGIAYALMEWAVPAIYSGSPTAPSGFNYGTSFVVPFSRAFGPWIAGIIVVLGPIAALRTAIDRYTYRHRVSAKRRSRKSSDRWLRPSRSRESESGQHEAAPRAKEEA